MSSETNLIETGGREEPPTRRADARLWPDGILVFGLALFVRCWFLFAPGFAIDQAQFLAWSEKSYAEGLAEVYAPRSGQDDRPWCNYPPGYIYVLRSLATAYDWMAPGGITLDEGVAVAVLQGEETQATRLAVRLFKAPAVLADGLLGVLLVIWLGHRVGRRWAIVVGAVYVLIPAVIHNSSVWGQVDAIPVLLIVGSLEFARRGNVRWMSALAVLALLTKAQAGMMLPLWLVVVALWAGRSWGRWLSILGTTMAVALVVLLPFRGRLDGVWQAYAGAANFYPFTHLNGFSAWFLANPMAMPHLGGNLLEWYVKDDMPRILGLSSRSAGMTCLICVWVWTMVMLWRRRAEERSLFWAARLLPLAFFVLSTQMHERYLFPAIAAWAWTFVNSRPWWIGWVLLSLCVSINVIWVWPGPGDGMWVTCCRQALQLKYLGLLPGVWCSLIFMWLFAAVLLGWLDGPRGRRTEQSSS